MDMDNIHRVYFIGIGGIGMSALARYFVFMGKAVAGYDRTPSALTRSLSESGMQIHYQDDITTVPHPFLEQGTTLVVYTPAVPSTHGEYQYFLENGFDVKKRSEVLGIITQQPFCLAVAGTHGKTTTSAILAHLLLEAGAPLIAFLGGISEDFNSNFILKGNEVAVVEADEYDRSFLKLHPNVACITSVDADHLDIYGDEEQLNQTFGAFAAKLDAGGTLYVRNGLPFKGLTYGLEDDADFRAEQIKVRDGAYVFDLVTPKKVLRDVVFKKPGRHNLLNAVVAFAMALEVTQDHGALAAALQSFKGVQRRFSYCLNSPDLVFIDDYAHHPAEIAAVHQAISEMHPGKGTLAVFQPHLFSRTRDLADDFAASLSLFDAVLLLEIYPAREAPIEGVDSAWLLDKIKVADKKKVTKEGLLSEVANRAPQVLVTMGAGDIGQEAQKLKQELAYAN
ncbi:UDP-N-acetylmuramate--L-alanine ligase [Maribacter sp. 2307ULW6-5]|uniref:UDP-N-acetylmuramate--L-alanine ligase n=1 Tax=Maribacter sp. 2307ULW6-5 TaxID=3386275 RepID=UPI0039BC688C